MTLKRLRIPIFMWIVLSAESVPTHTILPAIRTTAFHEFSGPHVLMRKSQQVLTDMLCIFERLLFTNKVQCGVNLPLKTVLNDELLNALADWNYITLRDPKLYSFVKSFLPDIRDDDSCADSFVYNLKSVEAQPSKSKEKDSLIRFHFCPPSDGMICGKNCICGHGSLGHGYI